MILHAYVEGVIGQLDGLDEVVLRVTAAEYESEVAE